MHHKLILLTTFMLLLIHFQGCISIRQTHPSSSDDCCELYDRPEAMRRLEVGWAENCKGRSIAWMSNQYGRCAAVKGSVQGWIQAKKDEANAPPWPRFHPVPTQNVFEPQATESPAEPVPPDVYGRFGKG